MHRSALFSAVTLALVAAVAAPVAAVDEDATPAAPGSARLDVVVTVEPETDATTVGEEIEAALGPDAEVLAVDEGMGLLATEVDVDAARALSVIDGVETIEASRSFELFLAESSPTIGAPALHLEGRTGAGAEVAVVDTGVDAALPGVDVVAEACFVTPEGAEPPVCPSETGSGAGAPCVGSTPIEIDDCAHGSHIASIVTAGPAGGAAHDGIAPDAGIVAVRVAHGDGSRMIKEFDVLRAVRHVADLALTRPLVAVNLSLGASLVPGQACADASGLTDEWLEVIADLEDRGVAMVAASGNLAPVENWEDVPVAFPACLPGVVAVGSTDDGGPVSSFTKADATLDLLAPGACVDTDVFSGDCSDTSGTSFAAPHVAAAYALLRSDPTGFTPQRRAELLRTTGTMVTRPTADPGDRDPRWALVDVVAASGFDPFDDAVGTVFWAAAADWGLWHDVTQGLDGRWFSASDPLTRAQAVTLLWRFMGSPTGFPPAGFVDVPAGSWYAAAVDWAYAQGITTGETATHFVPGAGVTRAQVAAFLHRLVGSPAVAHDAGFVDVAWWAYYAGAVDWMDEHGITTGTSPGVYSPLWVIDRGQMITFLFRLASVGAAWGGGVAPPDAVVRF